MEYDEEMRELTLMLLYLSSWQEKDIFTARRAWKGFRFEVLDELDEQKLIAQSKTAKSVLITAKGEAQAKELLRKYGLPDID